MATSCEDLVLNKIYTLDSRVNDRLLDRLNPSRKVTYVGESNDDFRPGYKEFLYEIDGPDIARGMGAIFVEPCFIDVTGDFLGFVEFRGVKPIYFPMSFIEGEIPDQYSVFKKKLDEARRNGV